MGLGGYSTEKLLMGGAALATFAFFFVAIVYPSIFTPKPDWGAADGCIGGQTDHADTDDSDIGVARHYHPRIQITIDGNQLPIPPNTGIDQLGCRGGMRWVHIHSASDSGFTTIHIETPDRMNVPLGAFFQVWDREGTPSLTEDRKFDINGNGVSDWEEYDISMIVNGKENKQFESFVMEDLDMIESLFTSK